MHINIRKWVNGLYESCLDRNIDSCLWHLYHLYLGAYITASSRIPPGTNIYNREWDLLIILDACRVDALQHVQPEYDFIDSVNSIWSVGSTSPEWMLNTFVTEYQSEISDTTYISGNPFTDRVFREGQTPPTIGGAAIEEAIPLCSPSYDTVDAGDFNSVRTLFRDYEGLNEPVPPRPITENAIARARKNSTESMIVHYMQPHMPFVGDDLHEKLTGTRSVIRGELRKGNVSREQIWEAYISTLRYVLDEVELLLDNVDAEMVAITADHGEGFGEYGAYSHYFGLPHPVVKKVPWAETTATDNRNHVTEPDDFSDTANSEQVENRLRDLGYLGK